MGGVNKAQHCASGLNGVKAEHSVGGMRNKAQHDAMFKARKGSLLVRRFGKVVLCF